MAYLKAGLLSVIAHVYDYFTTHNLILLVVTAQYSIRIAGLKVVSLITLFPYNLVVHYPFLENVNFLINPVGLTVTTFNNGSCQ